MRKVFCHFLFYVSFHTVQSRGKNQEHTDFHAILIQTLVRPSSRLPADQYLLEILVKCQLPTLGHVHTSKAS